MQTVSEQVLRKEYRMKINECIQSLQYSVEMSFNKIDEQLDEIVNQSNWVNIQKSQIQYDLPKMNPFHLLKQYEDNWTNSTSQQLNSLIQNNISIQQKDLKIQQLVNSQTIQQTSNITQSNHKPFTYQLIPQNSIKQNEHCRAIAFNKDYSTVIATSDKQIKVFEFKQGMLIQHQILSEHKNYIFTLNFMKRSDQFISGSADNSIIIWTKNENNSWIYQQKLNGHTSSIYCLVLNHNEDLIVSGSQDKTIKFWQKQTEWQCSQTITDHTQCVYALSLNEQQNKLISCGHDKLILVIEQKQLNTQWMVIQKIIIEQLGYRLCFIDDNTFTFQPHQKQYMHVFEMNSSDKQYTMTKHILVKGGSDCSLFPQQYIRSKCILVNKNGSNVTLLRSKQNGQFILEQSIQFENYCIFGCMSDDGQYLITWDPASKEYQIRKYQEK